MNKKVPLNDLPNNLVPQEDLPEEFEPQLIEGTEIPTFALQAEKGNYLPEGVAKHSKWHGLLNSLPIAGGIIGGLAGEGIASIPLAAGGTMAGEQLKQLIEALTGQRKRMDAKEALLWAPIKGASAEGAGQLIGKGFQLAQPKIAESMAGIPKENFIAILDKIKRGEPIFQKGAKEKAGNIIGQIAKEGDEGTSILYEPLMENIEKTIQSYEGGGINPAAKGAEKQINELKEMLEESRLSKMPEEKRIMLEALKEKYNLGGGINPELQSPKNIPFEGVHKIKQHLGESSKINWDKQTGQSNILMKDLYNTLNETLRKSHPEYEAANKAYQEALAEQSFNQPMPHYLTHKLARMGSLAGAGAIMGASHSNPLVMGLEGALMSQMSPLVQKQILKAYSTGAKTRMMPAIIQSLSQLFSKEQEQYDNALQSGQIPAEQYRNRK